MTYVIYGPHDGYRCAGMTHGSTPTLYAEDAFTKEQIAELQADPRMMCLRIPGTELYEPDKTPGAKVDPESLRLDDIIEKLSTKEAAAVAGVGQRTVQKWVRQGKVRLVQIVPIRMIARADLEAFLRTRQEPVETIPTRPEGQSFTLSDAARLCGVSRTTLQRAVRAGRLRLNADHQLEKGELIRAGYLDSDSQPTGIAEFLDQPDELADRLSDQVVDLLAENRAMRTRLERVEQELRALKSRKASAEQPRQQILAFMKSHPGPHRMRDIQKGLDWEHTPRFTLRHLVNDGLLRRVKPGVYEYPLSKDNCN